MVDRYGSSFMERGEVGGYRKTLPKILKVVRKEKDPSAFRARLLEISQLYFDGIITPEGDEPPEITGRWSWIFDFLQDQTGSDSIETLDELMKECAKYIGSFYRGEGEKTIGESRKSLLRLKNDLIRYGKVEDLPNHSHLNGSISDIRNLGILASNSEIQAIDYVIPVANEGFEPGFLLADIYESPLIPVRFSRLKRGDIGPRIPSEAEEENYIGRVRDKKVIVVEGTCCSGKSVEGVVELVSKYNPSQIYAACVLGSGLSGIRRYKEVNLNHDAVKRANHHQEGKLVQIIS